jgi:heme-degrading monooxygenase HmoA
VTVYTLGVWHVKAGREDDFVRAWDELAQWTLESGYESHGTLVRDRESPFRFVSFGPWPSAEAAGRWRDSDGFRERFARIEELVDRFEPQTLDVVMRVG